MTDTSDVRPLITGVSQFDVDFVIPRNGIDLPIGIDPFLLYKSRDPLLRSLHQQILNAFNAGIVAVRDKKHAHAHRLLNYPEAAEIGFGYTERGKGGSGVGTHLTGLIIDTLANSPQLLERGVTHVEEMQLLSSGIGPDRISDIAANILKRFLITYTQQQCAIWRIPVMAGVPIHHVYRPESEDWEDGYFDLPVSPVDRKPILLVPRRIVRTLPWINYDNFVRSEFHAYLAARREGIASGTSRRAEAASHLEASSKPAVVAVTRTDIRLIERYVKAREQASAEARPTFAYVDGDAVRQADALQSRLGNMPPGREHAAAYQHLVLEILNYLFSPELIDGKPEVKTIDGTERRDVLFTNDSDETFWDYVRTEHSSFVVMFETKNVETLDSPAFNQTATYLGDRLGTLGFIVTRNATPDAMQKKAFAIWNDSAPKRKLILTLSDNQLRELLAIRAKDESPTRWLQRHYRAFRTSVQ